MGSDLFTLYCDVVILYFFMSACNAGFCWQSDEFLTLLLLGYLYYNYHHCSRDATIQMRISITKVKQSNLIGFGNTKGC